MIGECYITAVMEGHKYNRVVRLHLTTQASLELASALDPHEPGHRGSPSRRIPQEHLHFPQ